MPSTPSWMVPFVMRLLPRQPGYPIWRCAAAKKKDVDDDEKKNEGELRRRETDVRRRVRRLPNDVGIFISLLMMLLFIKFYAISE